MKEIVGAQGEVTIIKIEAIPEGTMKAVERVPLGAIISHSESGNHHVLTGGDVIERVDNIPQGMRVLYAILNEPASLVQDTAAPHGRYDLAPGVYEFRCAREFDPFSDQARRVAD